MPIIGRRNFIAGLGLGAGAHLLAPIARGLIAEAQGAPPRKRFVVFSNGNGLIEELYAQKNARSETDFDLREIFEPFAPYRKDLLILEKFYNPKGVNLHGNYGETLTVGGGISLDRFIASKLGASDPVSSLNLAIYNGNGAPHLSFDGKGRQFPCEWNPLRAYEKIFGSAVTGGTSLGDLLVKRKRSLLDFMTTDIKRMQGRLAGPERAKLDQYLESVRGVEGRLTGLQEAQKACHRSAPGLTTNNDFKNSIVVPEVVSAFVDLTVGALACNLTHVGAISFYGGAEANIQWRFLGDTIGHHDQAHLAQNNGSGSPGMAMIMKIQTYITGQMAALWQQLKTLPEGNGSVADNTVVMLINSGGGRHHNGENKHAVVLLGGAGVLKTGRYVRFPGGERCVSDAFVSVANAVGVDSKTFGDPSICKGALPGLS